MKLFEVTIKFFCVAEDKSEAEAFHDLDGADIEAVEAVSAPSEWMDAIPFGDNYNDEKTVKEYLEEVHHDPTGRVVTDMITSTFEQKG